MGMTNKASRTQNHVRFNKQVPPAPKTRKKTAKRQPEELSPYVSDLSKTPSLKRADKVKFRKKMWIFFAIFIVAAADQALPEIRETLGLVASKAPEMVPELSGVVEKAEGFFNSTQAAVLILDTVGYSEPSHFNDPVVQLTSGTDLEVHELNEAWAHVSSEGMEEPFWVDRGTLLLSN